MRIVIRYRAARSRLARFVTGSLAAHGILAAIILLVPMMRRAPASFDDAMVVALAGPLTGSASAPASAPAPPRPAAPPPAEPPKPPPPKEAHTVREVPKPQPKATPPPRKKEEPVRSPAPAPVPSAPPQAEPPVDRPPSEQPQAGPGGPGGGGGGPTGVTATLGGGDASLGFYGAAVKAALESAWIKPYLEEQGATYSVSVSFVILRDGSTRDVRIASPSGVPSLDRSALRAVIEASPLPPIPPTWQSDSLPATMRFDLTPEGR